MMNMPPYLASPLDKALFASAPTYIQPRVDPLPDLACGAMRYVLAQNGLFLEARTRCIEASVRLADLSALSSDVHGLPYGEAREGVRWLQGSLSVQHFEQLAHAAIHAAPQEWAAYVVYDPNQQDYQVQPVHTHSVSAGHITQSTLSVDYTDQLFVHCHSHGYGGSFFSPHDDKADREGGDGIYVAVVLGACRSLETITAVARLVVHGWLIPLPLLPWATQAESRRVVTGVC